MSRTKRSLFVAFIGKLIASALATHAVAATDLPTSAADRLRSLSLDELMNIQVTTVGRQENTLGHATAAVAVITPEDISRSGATVIPELFRRVPGMSVAQIDANKWAISARGFNDRFANKLLVQADGRTLYSPILSGVMWDTVDYVLEDIERIEVVRGPGASVWGANAVNGVINLITKPAIETQGVSAEVGTGTEEQFLASVRYGATLGELGHYRVFVKGFNRDDSVSLNTVSHDRWQAIHTGFRADMEPSAVDKLTVQGAYVQSDAERIDYRPQPTTPFVFTNAETELSEGANVAGRWSRELQVNSRWTLQINWDHLKRDSTGDILHFTTDILDADFQHEFEMHERHRIVWGGGYRHTNAKFKDSRYDGFLLNWDRPQRDLELFSAFFQDEIAVVDNRLSVILGTKLEHNSLTGFEIQPTARLLFTPKADQTVWAAVSRAVRTPTLFEDQRSVTQTPAITPAGGVVFQRIVSNPELKAEIVRAYELGYRVQFTPALNLDMATFYNQYSDLKVFAPIARTTTGAPAGTSFQIVTHANQLQADTYGLEISAQFAPLHSWRLYAAYSYLQMQLSADASLPAATRTASEAAEHQSPEQQVYLQSSWDASPALAVDVITRFVDPLEGFQQPVKAYISLDLRVGWRLADKWNLQIAGQNLLADHHLENGGAILAGPLHEIQRGVYMKVSRTW